MSITEIKIRKTFDEDKLKAVLSITLDDFIVIHDIKIIDNGKRLFAAMPSRKDETGIFRDIVHPINSEIRDKIENEILDAYERYIIAAEVSRTAWIAEKATVLRLSEGRFICNILIFILIYGNIFA